MRVKVRRSNRANKLPNGVARHGHVQEGAEVSDGVVAEEVLSLVLASLRKRGEVAARVDGRRLGVDREPPERGLHSALREPAHAAGDARVARERDDGWHNLPLENARVRASGQNHD